MRGEPTNFPVPEWVVHWERNSNALVPDVVDEHGEFYCASWAEAKNKMEWVTHCGGKSRLYRIVPAGVAAMLDALKAASE